VVENLNRLSRGSGLRPPRRASRTSPGAAGFRCPLAGLCRSLSAPCARGFRSPPGATARWCVAVLGSHRLTRFSRHRAAPTTHWRAASR